MATESIAILIQHIESLSALSISYQSDNTKASLTAVIQKLNKIGICAGEQNMLGFQDVCFLLEDLLLDTPDGSIYKATQQQQLINWIELAKNYIYLPDDSNAENILKIFKVECWPMPLLETDANFMQEMLVKTDDATDAQNQLEEIEKTEYQTDSESSENASNEDIHLSLADCFTRLEHITSHENINDLDVLGRLSIAIDEFAQAAVKELSPGFQYVCLLFGENILELIEQGKDLSSTQNDLLIAWVSFAGKYIHDPENNSLRKALLLNLENQQWPRPLEHENTNMIVSMMGEGLKDNADTADETTDSVAELLPETELDSYADNDALEQLRQVLIEYKPDNAYLEKIIQHIENLGFYAKQLDLHGFHDVCLLLQQNLEDLSDENNLISESQLQSLQDWATSAHSYLNNPNNRSLLSSLTQILIESHWPTSLTEEDVNLIQEMFELSDIAEADHEQTPDINIFDSEFSGDETDNTMTDSVDSLKLAIGNHKTELSLEDIITHLERLSVYAAGSALHGFEDVCMLLQQNLEDLVADKKELSDAQYQTLQQWTAAAADYVDDQNNHTTVLSLLNALTASHWPVALTEVDLPLMEKMFGIIEESVQVEDALPTMDVKTEDSDAKELVTGSVDDIHVVVEACPVSPMLIDMLLDEIKQVEQDIEEIKTEISSESAEKKSRSNALMQLSVRFERFGNACQAAELIGLYQAFEIMWKNIALLNAGDAIASQELGALIGTWPEFVEKYLLLLGDDASSDNLVNTLSCKAWGKPLMLEATPALIDLLNAPYSSEEETKEIRQTEASAEDVSLELPTDINQELLDGLLQELPVQTEGFSNAIQALIDGSGDSRESEKAQRIAHAVKGAANTVGIRGIASLTHQIEDLFLFLNKHERLPSKALAASLIVAADCLEEMSESLMSEGDAPANSLEVFQDMLDWINRLENEGVEILDDDIVLIPESIAKKEEPKGESTDDVVEDKQQTVAILRVQAPLIDDLIRLLGETIILTTQLQERMKISIDKTENLILQNRTSHELINQLERQIEIHGIANLPQAVHQDEVFDSLELEHYNELNTITNQLAETTIDSVELNIDIKHDLRELGEVLVDQSRLHKEVQGLVMRTRMVPMETITPRLQRSVRQTCRAVGKQATLHLTGTDTLIDSDILNNLINPLIHILRNSLDHGIEDHDERMHKNKNPEGRIDLSFSSEGTQIVIRCKDDGAGLDHDAIRVVAIKRELIKPDEKLTSTELDRMILRPGFSTSTKTTQVSGRGIGMDLVYSQILANKGTLHIESERDKGLLIELRMPMTLISSHVLMIKHNNRMLAISSRGITQILHPSDSEIVESKHGLLCKVGDQFLELNNLEDLINFPGDLPLDYQKTRSALSIQEDDINKVIYVQEVVDSRELVVKSMGKHISDIPGILGATILGDGSVVPVLDLLDLLRSSTQVQGMADRSASIHTTTSTSLTVLAVDDSLSARRALAQIVRDAGYHVKTAKDGIEAVSVIDKQTPDILLVDMEMPRMNGMELTAYVRANPKTKDIPVIMVTSRSTEKHRKQASSAGVNVYLTKPFSEDDLLDHITKLLN